MYTIYLIHNKHLIAKFIAPIASQRGVAEFHKRDIKSGHDAAFVCKAYCDRLAYSVFDKLIILAGNGGVAV